MSKQPSKIERSYAKEEDGEIVPNFGDRAVATPYIRWWRAAGRPEDWLKARALLPQTEGVTVDTVGNIYLNGTLKLPAGPRPQGEQSSEASSSKDPQREKGSKETPEAKDPKGKPETKDSKAKPKAKDSKEPPKAFGSKPSPAFGAAPRRGPPAATAQGTSFRDAAIKGSAFEQSDATKSSQKAKDARGTGSQRGGLLGNHHNLRRLPQGARHPDGPVVARGMHSTMVCKTEILAGKDDYGCSHKGAYNRPPGDNPCRLKHHVAELNKEETSSLRNTEKGCRWLLNYRHRSTKFGFEDTKDFPRWSSEATPALAPITPSTLKQRGRRDWEILQQQQKHAAEQAKAQRKAEYQSRVRTYEEGGVEWTVVDRGLSYNRAAEFAFDAASYKSAGCKQAWADDAEELEQAAAEREKKTEEWQNFASKGEEGKDDVFMDPCDPSRQYQTPGFEEVIDEDAPKKQSSGEKKDAGGVPIVVNEPQEDRPDAKDSAPKQEEEKGER